MFDFYKDMETFLPGVKRYVPDAAIRERTEQLFALPKPSRDVPILAFPPTTFPLVVGFPKDDLICFAFRTGQADFRYLGLEHLRLPDDQISADKDVRITYPAREIAVGQFLNKFYSDMTRVYAHMPLGRLQLETYTMPDLIELLRDLPDNAAEYGFGEVGKAIRSAHIHNMFGQGAKVEALQADIEMSEHFLLVGRMLRNQHSGDDVMLWFGLREYAWCASKRERGGPEFRQFTDLHLRNVYSRNMKFEKLFGLADLEALCVKQGYGKPAEIPDHALKTFMFGGKSQFLSDIGQAGASLRDHVVTTNLVADVIDGIPSATMFGRSHAVDHYERMTYLLRKEGFRIDEQPGWARHMDDGPHGFDIDILRGRSQQSLSSPRERRLKALLDVQTNLNDIPYNLGL